MSESEIIIDRIKYRPLREAAAAVGISSGYLSKFCREGQVRATRIDGVWFVNETSLRDLLEDIDSRKREWHERLSAQRQAERSAPEPSKHRDADFVPLPRSRVAPRTLHRVVAERRARETSSRRSVAIASIASLLFLSSLGFAFTSSAPIAIAPRASTALIADIGSSFVRKFTSFFDSMFASNDYHIPPAWEKTVIDTPASARGGDTINNTTNNNYVTNNNYIQTGTASGGISERLMDSKLNALENYLTGRIELAEYRGDRQAESLADTFSDGIGGGGFEDIDITDSTFTGGSISGASLSGVSFSGETTFPAILTTDATTTNLYIEGSFGFGTSSGLLHTSNGIASTLTNGSNGQVLKMVGGNLQWSTDLTGSGGGGASFFASTTDDLAIYPADPDDVVIIGDSATTTVGNILEVAGDALVRGGLTAYGDLTSARFVATSSAASILPYASTTALSATALCLSSDCRTAWPSFTDTSFSTTSADYWKSVNNFFATSSADAWKLTRDFFSTTSISYFLSQNQGAAFSTTSAGYWKSMNDFFSTTSAAYFLTQNGSLGFSTTSTDYWMTQRDFFSTTSANYWESQQTPRTADNLTDNSIEDLNDVAAMTKEYGDLLYWNGSSWADIATSSLGLVRFSDLSSSLSGYLSLAAWYATTTDALAEGGANRYFTAQRVQDHLDTVTKGFFFSTTSADAWKDQRNFFSTTSTEHLLSTYGKGFFFSTTSASYFLSEQGTLGFSTTSSDYWATQRDFFSTTSANYFAHSSTTIPKTYAANAFTALQTFGNASSSIFSATTLCLSNDCRTSWPAAGSSFEYPFFGAGNSTSTLTQFHGGLTAYASTTVGNGTAAGGLTISGTATTSRLVVTSTATSTFGGDILMLGSIIPSLDNTYSLGSMDRMWKDVYIGPGSLYVNGQKVIEDDGPNIVVTADPGQNLAIQSQGTGDIELSPLGTGVIQLKGSVQLTAGNALTMSDNSPVSMLDGAALGNITISGNTIQATNTNGGISLTPAGNGGTYITAGNLGIGTTSPGSKLSIAGDMFATGNIISSSLTASRLPYASTTALSATTLCLTGDSCISSWPSFIDTSFSTTSADFWQTQRDFFSTTSADYYKSVNNFFSTTSADYWKSASNFFSTTSASYFLAQNQGAAFSTTSADHLLSTYNKGFFFSTTSANHFLTQNGSLGFSTTSNDHWMTQRNFFSTTSADAWKDQRNFFSTSSASYFSSLGLAFSTTSADAWKLTRDFFSTTSSNYWQTTRDFFSTTSATYFAHSSTTIPKTYTANSFTATQTFTNASSTLFSTNYASSTSGFFGNLSIGSLSGFLKATAGSIATAAIDLASDVTGILGVARGGTGWSTVQAGSLIYGNGSSALATTSAGTGGQVLALVGNVPTWVATTTFSSGLTYSNGNVTLDTSGNWTGTFDGLEGSAYLANAFSTTSADYWKLNRDFFSTTSAIYFTHSSTTIPKTYTANTYTGLQIFTNASSTLFSSSYASTTNLFTGNLTLANLNGPLHASGGVVSATTSIGVLYGGTGLTTAPTYGQLLMGNGSGGYTLTATTSLGISGGSSFAYPFPSNATSTLLSFNAGLTAYASSTIGDGTAAGGLTISGGATTTGDLRVGGNFGAAGLIEAGSLISAPSAIFSTSIESAIGGFSSLFAGTASTTVASAYDALYVGRTATTTIRGDNATSSIAGALTTSGSLGIGTTTPASLLSLAGTSGIFASTTATSTFFGGGINLVTSSGNTGCFAINGTCIGGGGSLTGTQGQVAYFSGTDTAIGTSTLFISSSEKVGIGTSSPWAKLSVSSYNGGTTPLFAVASSTGSGATSTAFFIDPYGNVGVGTTSMVGSFAGFGLIDKLKVDMSGMNAFQDTGLTVTGSRTTGGTFTSMRGILSTPTYTGSGSGTNGLTQLSGGIFAPSSNGGGEVASMIGLSAAPSSASGTSTTITGIFAQPQIAAGTTTQMIGVHSAPSPGSFAFSSIGSMYSFYADPSPLTVGAIIGNYYGIYLDAPPAAQTNITGARYGVYQADALATNVLDGVRTGIGTTSPFAKLSVHAAAGNTNTTLFAIASSTNAATTTLFSISNTGSTTAANGFNITAGCYAVGGVCLSAGGSFSTTSADYYVHSSTTIPKLYSSNTWTGSNIFSGTLTLGSLNGPLQANNGVVSATTSIGVLYGGTGLTTAPTYGQMLVGNSSGGYTLMATSSLGITGGSTGDQIAIIIDQKNDGTNGGSSTAGSWLTRDINTEITDAIGVSISSNQFTLPAGTYMIQWSAPAVDLRSHQTRLYNVSDATVAQYGQTAYADDGGDVANHSEGVAYIAIDASKAFRIEHRTEQTKATTGFGLASSFTGNPEIYTTIRIRKLNGSATVATFTGASASTNGTAGLVPQPLSGEQGSVLLGDGSWLASTTLFVSTTTARLGIGTTTPWAKLAIQGDSGQLNPVFEVASSSTATKFLSVSSTGFGTTTLSGLNISGSATTTSNVGMNLTGGCYAIGGVCLGGGSSSFDYLFPSNATSTLLSFNGGLSTSALTLGTLNGPLHANNGVVSATTSIGILYGGTGLTVAPTYGQLLVGNSSGGYDLVATSSLGITGGSTGDQIAIIVDQKADGTGGGTFTSGAWRTRDLNTELHDDIGVTLSSNEFTLPAGTYEVRINAPAYRVDYHQARLYNSSDAAVVLTGTSEIANDSSNTATHSFITGTFTITSTKTFRVEHDADTTNATSGFGLASSATGIPEVYTQVHIRKLNGSATVATFTGATATANGTAGLVPQPLSGEQGSVLLGDGNWLASTTLFVSTTTARIGIGTTTPWAKLSITSTAGIPQFLIGSSTTQFIVDKNGKVGIGTTTPLQRLTVGNVSSAANEFIHVLGQNNAGIIIEADTDNVTETHNPYIKFLQDGAAVAGILGLTGGADVDPEGTALTGALGNTLLLANHYSAGALQLGTNATARLTIDSTGNVGIGTTTPISTLSVQGSLCVRSTGSCGTTAGTIYATTAAISDIDLAENYRAIDVTLVPGEIVALLEGSTSTIRRAVQGEEGLGVLSTKPGLLLGQEIKDGRAVALKGRVPLKVNMEGGPIAVGDRLTVSSVAGVGTKATTSSYTVARALEAASTDGVIEVFVENEYTLVIDEKNALRDLLNATSTATSSPVFANIFARMTEWLAHAGNGITELFAKTIRAENVYADTVTANEICVKKSNGTHVCITGDEIESLMNGSPLPEPTPAPEPEPTPESDETTGGDEGEEVGDGGEGIVPSEDAAVPPADQATEPTAEVPATTSEDPVE